MTLDEAQRLAKLLSQIDETDDTDTWCVCCFCMRILATRLSEAFPAFAWHDIPCNDDAHSSEITVRLLGE